jgi:glycosyltransferase involved in cell wall biosynthesis
MSRPWDLLVAGSYLALADLLGLAPELRSVPSILYFHENQLAYPVRDELTGERDLHFGLTQMISALVATRCLFNSRYNLTSFVEGGAALLERMPDAIPTGWMAQIAEKSAVLPVPLDLPDLAPSTFAGADHSDRERGPIIVWNHRWEHDKGPERFLSALRHLAQVGVDFRVAVCGQQYRQSPGVFEEARGWLGDRVVHWGFANRDDYADILAGAHLAVSTARHEFFGISMLEATYYGAYPLVPNRLAYPEIYPPSHCYLDDADLVQHLTRLCRGWSSGERDLRADRRDLVEPYRQEQLLPQYERLFESLITTRK